MHKGEKTIVRTGNNRFLKEYNQAGVLDLIRLHGTLSRAEISNLTGLSPTAVGKIVSALIEKGYIHEVGEGKSSGGRRPILLELMPRSFFSVGIDLDVSGIRIVIIDITGSVIYRSFYSFNNVGDRRSFSDVIKRVKDICEKAVCELKIGFEKILGIGISVPGIVDPKNRKIISAPNMKWKDICLEAYLNENFNVPVHVENEAMASAICENWIGCCRDLRDFVCINIGTGIGSGIFAGGKLYRGVGGSAGEIGHIVVNENGPKCGCGNYGCLETMASIASIMEKVKKLPTYGNMDIDFDAVVKAARDGDEEVKKILSESAKYLGIAISYIVNVLNPSKIVLGREFVKYAELVTDYIKNIVKCKALKHPESCLEIAVSEIGEDSSALVASIIPLKILFCR